MSSNTQKEQMPGWLRENGSQGKGLLSTVGLTPLALLQMPQDPYRTPSLPTELSPPLPYKLRTTEEGPQLLGLGGGSPPETKD